VSGSPSPADERCGNRRRPWRYFEPDSRALERNADGHLSSIDLPPILERVLAQQTGAAISDRQRARWTLVLGSSCRKLPSLLHRLGAIGLFVHDSIQTERNLVFEWSSVLPFMRPGGVLVADDVHRNHGLTTFRNRTSRAGCSLGSLQTDKASSRSPRLRLAEPLVSLTGVRSLGDRLPRPVAEAPPPRRAADPTCGRGRSSAQTSPCGLVVDNQLALVLSSDDVETSLCERLLKEPEQQPEHRSNGSTSNGPAAGSCASDHLQGLIGRLPGRICAGLAFHAEMFHYLWGYGEREKAVARSIADHLRPRHG
jgi:hypothetical protein